MNHNPNHHWRKDLHHHLNYSPQTSCEVENNRRQRATVHQGSPDFRFSDGDFANSAVLRCLKLHIIVKRLDILAILLLMFPRVASNPLVSALKPTLREESLFGCSIPSMVGQAERESCFSAILGKS